MNAKGFTLIEMIIAIVMISVASVVMMTFLSSGFSHIGDPLNVLDDNYAVSRAIEVVHADYRARLEDNPGQTMAFYVAQNLSSKINDLGSAYVKGEYIDFSPPDADRKVSETEPAGISMYVKITAQKNNSRLITILGN